MNPTLIKELQDKIANDAYLLYEALANLAPDNAENIASAIEAINDYVKEIGEGAQKAQLIGLSTVCQQTSQNITTLSTLDSEQLQTLGIEIERWPKLVSNYLYSPLNSNVNDQLVHFLQDEKWPQSIENELANQLRDELKADFINQPDESIDSPVPTETIINSSDVVVESTTPEKNAADESLDSPAPTEINKNNNDVVVENTAPEKNEADESIDSPLPKEADINSEIVESTTPENSEVDQSIDSPVPQETSEVAQNLTQEKNEANESIDSLAPTEISKNNEIVESTTSEKAEVDQSIDSPMQQETNINQHEVAKSVTQEKTETSNDTQTLDDEVTTDSLPNDSRSTNNEPLPTSPLYDKFIEMNDNLSAALTQIITLDAENEVFFDGLNQYTDTIQIFWELAESLGLKGFQDVCTFINDNVFECSSLSKSEKKKLQKPLILWPKKSKAYLKKPETNAPKLVKLLCTKYWPIKLSTEKSEHLLTQLVQDCSAPIITENHQNTQTPKATPKPNDNDNVVAESVEKDPLKSEPISVEIATNPLFDSESLSDEQEISDDTPEVFEPFYQQNEFEPFELDTFNLTSPDSENSSSSSKVEEAWITSHLENTWIEKDLATDWELDEEEERVSLLSQQMTDDSIMEAGNESVQSKGKYEVSEEISVDVEPLEKTDNLSNEINQLSIEDVNLLSDLTQETKPLESVDSTISEETKEFPLDTEELEFVSQEVENESKDSPTQAEELPQADSEFDEESPITNSELEWNEELLQTQETTELTNDEALSEDNLLADDFELPIDEAKLSKQEPDLSTDSLIEPEAEFLEASEEISTDSTITQQEELSIQEPDLSTDTDEFSEPPLDLFTEDSIDNSDLPSQNKEQSIQKTDNSVSKEAEPRTPVSDSSIEELSDPLSTLDEGNLFSEEIDELQLLTDDTSDFSDEKTLSETYQVTEDLSVADDNQSCSIEKTDDIVETSKASNEIILCSQDVLELLIGQIRDIADDNASLMTDLMDAEDGSEQVLTATMTYTENVQAIWDAAEMANLTGLQDLCTFVNDNVMAFGSQSQSERNVARDVLLAWSENVIAYLQNPLPNVDRLVSGLQHEHWLTPLDNEVALALKQSLLTPVTAEIEQTVVDETLSTSETEGNELEVVSEPNEVVSKPDITLAPPEVLDLLIAQISDISENNAELINELVGEGSEAVFTAITTYTDHVQAVWDAAEMASLNGLLEVCTFLNDNVMALGGCPQSDREAARSVLLAWPELMIAYLQNPGTHAKALINLMQDNQWPSAIEETETENLFISLTTSSSDSSIESSLSESSTEASSETLVLATPDIVELVCNQIIDSQEGLSAALEVCISMENDNPAFLEAIEEYSNKVQEIVDVAEMSGLTGLIEVCTFINTNFVEFSIQEKSQRVEAQQSFLTWPAKVLDYLHSPNTGASQLIHFMQEKSWPDPLSEEAAVELFTLLTQPAQTYGDSEKTSISKETEPTIESDDNDDDEIQELTPLAVSIPDKIKLCKPDELEVLLGGIEWGKEDLALALNQLITLSQQEPDFAEAQENYTKLLHDWSSAAEMAGLEALQTIFGFVTSNVNELQKVPPEVVKKAKNILEKWPNLVLAYLQAPTDNAVKLVNHFRLAKWVQPLTDEAAQALLTQLAAGAKEVASELNDDSKRETEAHPEDVILTPQDDVDPELWEAYLQELPQNAESFSGSIQRIIQEPDIEEIKSAQRVAHTMKGSSRIVGVKGIANIAHHLEDTLEYLAEHQLAPPEALTNMMVEAADCLSIMVDALSGNDEPPTNALDILQSVLDWANQMDKGELEAPPVPPKTKAESVQPATTSEVVPDKQPKTDNKKKADKPATPEQMLQVPTKTIDELMRLVGELSISLGQIQEKLKHVTQNTRQLTERDLILQKKTFELENLVDVRGITGVENRYKRAATSEEEDFDPLEFEEYNELHSVAHSFTESIADNRELAISIREELSELETMFIHQERLNKDFQNSIMTTRMKQVKTIIPQLERNIRKTVNDLKNKEKIDKKAKLEVAGTDILVDSEVLNNLIAPLRHVLNNAVDHGLESIEERAIVGKSEMGTIHLSFYHEGNNVVIKCQDDGQGLNYTNIRFKAIEKELITEHQELTEQELARLILMSGFSTKPGVTQVSGRGVGMDVVHTTIRQMKGTIDLTSETGKGTTFLIKLPMTLVTVHVLVVRVGDRLFGIPTNNLEQALAPNVAEFHTVGEETTLKLGKNLYAVKYLADMLHMKGDWQGFNDLEKRPVVLVHEETGITAVLVDEFLDTHDLVMKSMGQYVKKIHGVAGASILGNGSLVPLLDVPELLRSPMQAAISAYTAKHSVEDDANIGSAMPNIMIVDDSLSVRKSLSLLIENAGFEPLLAKDGVEAIEVMNETQPNVMLVDMEMPRMDGLELTAHVRANQATQNLPIFMITSRTTEKHRLQAKSAGVSAYLTKPYQDTELLDLIDKALSGQI
jgi:chemotaxis protein histidine kinase CheA/CheY-like chemotaxis protein